MEPVELVGAGVLLRPWRPADAPAVLAALRDPAVARWNPQPDVVDLDGARRWAAARADWSSGTHASFAVADPDSGTLLGSLSVHRIHDQEAEIGYWTVPAARGRGVATRAVRTATDWAFHRLDLHRIALYHAVANPASCAVASGAGYALEGVLRQSHRYGDRVRHDEHLHARLAGDPAPGTHPPDSPGSGGRKDAGPADPGGRRDA